ncbi:MAG: cobalamin-dependent protein [Gemmatimonadaceae bacterium]|nr:cobalamin-dependent protein [Gemmatimonadaceae bacterium]
MTESTGKPVLHPMRVVAQRTGLTPDLLRAWEKRYGAVAPVRSAGGQRHYTDADVERLSLLVRATRSGRQIGQVASLANAELQKVIEADERAAALNRAPSSDGPAPEIFLSTALMAIEAFDAYTLEQTLRAAALRLPADDVLDQVFGPLLFTVGSLWHQGQLQPANEHLASTTIRRVLTWMGEVASPGMGAPVVIVGTPAGHLHEIGAMLAATTASGSGWRVIYLGPNLPAEELARAAKQVKADVVALSIVYPTSDTTVVDELRRLRAHLPSTTGIVVGGAGATSYGDVLREIGADALNSLTALRQWLRRRVRG